MVEKRVSTYDPLIPVEFNNKNKEVLDESLYCSELFKDCEHINDMFCKISLNLNRKKDELLDVVGTSDFSSEFITAFENELDLLDKEFNEFHNSLQLGLDKFFEHLAQKYSK